MTDLSAGEPTLPRRHRRNVAKALDQLSVETCANPVEILDAWVDLYSQLIQRHAITGISAFSRDCFRQQLTVPGLTLLKASTGGEIVGLHWWFEHDDVAYGHLGATSARGYDLMASYALYWHAIQHFRRRVRWLDLGGAAGPPEHSSENGLTHFKSGWSTGVRQVYLCGRIFQPHTYARLVEASGVGATSYFPAYRSADISMRGHVL